MKLFLIAMTLILSITVSSVCAPVAGSASDGLYASDIQKQIDALPSDLKLQLDSANAKVKQYATTHTGPETLEYARVLLNQITENNLDFDYGVYDQEWGPVETYGSGGTADDERRRKCIADQKEACRTEYNAELFQSAAIGTGVFLGCGALTAGTGIIFCAARGLGVHALGIAAARQRRQACELRAPYMCG